MNRKLHLPLVDVQLWTVLRMWTQDPCIWRWRYLIPLDNLGILWGEPGRNWATRCLQSLQSSECPMLASAFCPGHWLLTILPTWEKPRERGGCCQTQLPRNVAETLSWKASRQESDPCTASVHTAFLKQLFTLRNYTLGLINRLLWAGVWVSHTIVNICQKRSVFLRVLAAWVISQEKCWAVTAGGTAILSRSSVPDCQVWNHWLHSWLCPGSQSQAISWLPDPLGQVSFLY